MSADAGGAPDTLTVQVQGGGEEPERVLVLSRPRDGRVAVREFAIGAGDEGGPTEYSCSPDAVLAVIERATRERRRVSEDVQTIRRWLEGR